MQADTKVGNVPVGGWVGGWARLSLLHLGVLGELVGLISAPTTLQLCLADCVKELGILTFEFVSRCACGRSDGLVAL